MGVCDTGYPSPYPLPVRGEGEFLFAGVIGSGAAAAKHHQKLFSPLPGEQGQRGEGSSGQ